ncbi:uncharacterized protein TNCV_4250131 [Trichonephila clavipes]|nr:uncharacterized protein TNCV_4250131 [Trichonephila clavipes]
MSRGRNNMEQVVLTELRINTSDIYRWRDAHSLVTFYFDLYVVDTVEQKACYFRVLSARKTSDRLLNVPRLTVSNVMCRFKELDNHSRLPGSERKRTVNTLRNHKAIEKRLNEAWTEALQVANSSASQWKNKLVRLRRCRRLSRWAASQRWESILFIDEKLFRVQQVHNFPKDRVWCVDAPSTPAIVEHRQYRKSVMVWG